MKIQVNKDLPGYAAGVIVSVEADEEGNPLRRFWRDRLHDAITDNCVEIIKPEPKPTAKKQATED